MATTFDEVKTWVPSLGEYRAYLFSTYQSGNINCVYVLSTVHRCHYFPGENAMGFNSNMTWVSVDHWQNGHPLHGFNELSIGSWVTIQFPGEPSPRCHEVIGSVDETTFNTGTCTICPPTSNCPNPPGCLYNNTITPNGLGVTHFGNVPLINDPGYPWTNGTEYFTYNVTTCQDCITNTPPNFNPNIIVNCCDSTERYTFPPVTLSTTVYDDIVGTGAGQLGVTNYQEAFRADFYIGGATTGYKCWHLEHDPQPFGPHVYTVTIDPAQKYPDCGHLNHHITSSFTPPYKPCCDPEVTGCTSNNLQVLQSALDTFKVIRDNTITP